MRTYPPVSRHGTGGRARPQNSSGPPSTPRPRVGKCVGRVGMPPRAPTTRLRRYSHMVQKPLGEIAGRVRRWALVKAVVQKGARNATVRYSHMSYPILYFPVMFKYVASRIDITSPVASLPRV